LIAAYLKEYVCLSVEEWADKPAADEVGAALEPNAKEPGYGK
jgi:hypothetical protein